jgi:hypothetical protein
MLIKQDNGNNEICKSMHVKDEKNEIASYHMVHWHVRDNDHGLTKMIRVSLMVKICLLLICGLGFNGCS